MLLAQSVPVDKFSSRKHIERVQLEKLRKRGKFTTKRKSNEDTNSWRLQRVGATDNVSEAWLGSLETRDGKGAPLIFASDLVASLESRGGKGASGS